MLILDEIIIMIYFVISRSNILLISTNVIWHTGEHILSFK